MPTIGQLKFFFRVLDRDFFGARLDRADFVRLGFFRERDAFLNGGFAAMEL